MTQQNNFRFETLYKGHSPCKYSIILTDPERNLQGIVNHRFKREGKEQYLFYRV